jgi:hypothetical protein
MNLGHANTLFYLSKPGQILIEVAQAIGYYCALCAAT